jgi:two-component system chemotaxis response regulator CheY
MECDPSPSHRLLAIDDSADSAELVARVAAGCGVEARAASESRSIPKLIASYQPDLITLDLCMPEIDGIDLLSLLQEARYAGSLMIISGQDDWFRAAVAMLARARGLTVIGDLHKPLDIDSLRASLTTWRKQAALSLATALP